MTGHGQAKRPPDFDPENPYADWGEEYEETQQQTNGDRTRRKEPKYYWLKLKDVFFESKYIRALRAKPNGDMLTLIYLHLNLKALKSEGHLGYSKLMPTFEEELALDLGESVEAVRSTLDVLESFGLIERDDETVNMVRMPELIDYGSETAAAERMRRKRSKDKQA